MDVMTAVAWAPRAFAGLDIESTSTDVEDARTIEICLVLVTPGQDPTVHHSLINPGVEIPQEAIDVHGITNERIQAEGKPPVEVLDVFAARIALAQHRGLPLIIMNAPYDLTVLDRDCRRWGIPTIEDRLGRPIGPVLDPMVLDKRCVKYRRKVSDKQGARQLKTICQAYGLPWDDELAHAAQYDCFQAARAVWKIATLAGMSREQLAEVQVGPFDPPKPLHRNDIAAFQRIGRMSLGELHEAQVGWYREQTEGLAQFWNRERNDWLAHAERAAERGDDEQRDVGEGKAAEYATKIDSLTYGWPIRPYVEQGVLV